MRLEVEHGKRETDDTRDILLTGCSLLSQCSR